MKNFERETSGLFMPRGLTRGGDTRELQAIARRWGVQMSAGIWDELIYEQMGNGPTLTAAAEALMVQDVNIPMNYMVARRVLGVVMWGKQSNAVTTPGTITFRIRWGGIGGVVLVASAALTQNVIVQTDKTWWLWAEIQCQTEGATGTFLTAGTMERGNQAAAVVADMTPDMLPAASLANVTVDTTIAKLLSITAQPSLATASITCMGYQLFSRN